ncbi:MAG TPA: winged helix DNA-binding domain-containing protein [Candidatus Limnocylindrales bacterium]|nr:winged helix DNA-binding domain-containing protein [Candidatus Limnocylindrales bacterium]
MKAKGPVAAELTWAQVHAFRLKRHHLTGRAKKTDLPQVVADIGGVQAQVMSAAELQVAVRVDCTVADVRKALWTDRALVKTWLMRGTLHLARSEDLPIYCAAMSTRGIKVRPSWLKYFQLTEGELWNVVDEIGAALNGTPLTREELIAVVGNGKPARILESLRSGWGGMLKPAARDGTLCFGPSRGQSVTFVSPQKWLPSWRRVDRDTAFAQMARRYLRAYGPASKTDFARWWGAWPGVGNAAWSALGDEIVPVSVEGARLDAHAADIDEIRGATVEDSVQLLPGFDPYVLGHASRDHLVDPAFASRVSRTAGWISAVVLVDGEAVGTWTHTMANQVLRLTVSPFRRIAPRVKTQVGIRAEELAHAMSAKKTEVKFA